MDNPELLKLVGLDDFVALDFETTGLNPNSDKIIEIGAVRFEAGQPVDELQQLINLSLSLPYRDQFPVCRSREKQWGCTTSYAVSADILVVDNLSN